MELPDEPDKYSMYASENLGIKGPHRDGSFPRVRRFTMRKDGFVSVRAEHELGELATKPLIFAGDKLTINYNAQLAEDGSVSVLKFRMTKSAQSRASRSTIATRFPRTKSTPR